MINQIPLQTYLGMLMMSYATSSSALNILKRGSLNLSPHLQEQAKNLQAKIRQQDSRELESELHSQLKHRFGEIFLAAQLLGQYEYDRNEHKQEIVWSEGSTNVHYFAANNESDAPVIIFIPSLINRSYILDLSEKRSFLRYLQKKNITSYLVDWGEPEDGEMSFCLDDYIAGRLDKIIEYVANKTGRKIILAGYCMGGVMSIAAALRNKNKLNGLALIATPWDFHVEDFARFELGEDSIEKLSGIIKNLKKIDASIIQSMFYYLHSDSVRQKLEIFSQAESGSEELEEFMALENWINDGISMTKNVAKECFINWAHYNNLENGTWKVAGEVVEPAKIDLPVLFVTAKKDHIVPPASTGPLTKLIKNHEHIKTQLGHVSMVAGEKARRAVWKPFSNWVFSVI
jgi:polyhydroxyalkanoate synthase